MAFKTPTLASLGTLAAGVSVLALGVAATHAGTGYAVLEFPLEIQPGTVSLRFVGEPEQDEGMVLTFYVDVVDAIPGNSIVLAVSGTVAASDFTMDVGADLPLTAGGTYSFPVTVRLTADDLTEGDESITIGITGYTGLTANGVQSYTLNVNDTSLTPAPTAPVLDPPDPASPTYITLGGGMGYSTGTTKAGSYSVVGGASYRFKFPRGNGYRIKHRTSSGSGTYVYLPQIFLTDDPEVERNFDFTDTYHANGVTGTRYFSFEIMEAGGFFGDATHLVKFYKTSDGAAADAPQAVVLSSTAPASVNEGSDVAFTLTFTDANAGQQVDLSVVGDFGAVTWGTVAGLTTSGQRVNVTADGSYVLSGSVSVPADNLTEGAENLVLSLVSPTNGLTASGSKTVTINDTSLTPAAASTISMARNGHGSTINEGTIMSTRFTVVNAPVGATWEVTADNSPLAESDFVNTLAVDAAANRPAGISVVVTSRTVKYETTAAGSFSVDLTRPVKNDLQTETATEQYNLKLQNVVGLTVSGGALISNWVSDTSQSPPYVPPTATTTASPMVAAPAIHRGTNLAGAEFASAVYPQTSKMDWIIAQNFRNGIVRLPFKASRAMKGGTMAATDLDPTFKTAFQTAINKLSAAGLVAMPDAHDYAKVGSTILGTGDNNATNFARMWRMISDQLCVGKKVFFDLQNEPNGLTDAQYEGVYDACDAACDAIRASGHAGHVVYPGPGWSGVSQFVGDGVIRFKAHTAGKSNVIQGLHSYPDKQSSGSDNGVRPTTDPAYRSYNDENWDIARTGGDELSNPINLDVWVQRWTQPVQVARANGVLLGIGEFGAGVDTSSIEALHRFIAFINANADVIRFYTHWSAGPWSASYIRAIGPDSRNNSQVAELI